MKFWQNFALSWLIGTVSWSITLHGAVDPKIKPPKEMLTVTAPHIEGDTLYIQGPIDDHLYDALMFPDPQMQNVRVVDLNS